MAGRPRTMARRVHQLLERQIALGAELQSLMPHQYLEPTTDVLGSCWQSAIEGVGGASEYLHDLWCILDLKAAKADERKIAALDAMRPSLLVDDQIPSQDEHATDRTGNR